MDRREALKKLAAGAVVGASAPLIISSQAFAVDQGTVSCLPTPFDGQITALANALRVEALTTSGDVVGTADFVRLRLPETDAALTAIGCPGGYTRAVQYFWTINTAPAGTTFSPNVGGSWGTSNQVRLVTSGNNTLATDPPLVATSYDVDLGIRVTCRNSTRVCFRCLNINIRFDWTYDPSLTPSTTSNVAKVGTAGRGDCTSNPLGPA